MSIESHPIWEENELREGIRDFLVHKENFLLWLSESKSTIECRVNHPPGHYIFRTFRNKEVIIIFLNSLGTIREQRADKEYIYQR